MDHAADINSPIGAPMAFKPNYGRDRAERQRAARARSEEKQRKKQEKNARRKVEHAPAEPGSNDENTSDLPEKAT
jgi:hypothetical protein